MVKYEVYPGNPRHCHSANATIDDVIKKQESMLLFENIIMNDVKQYICLKQEHKAGKKLVLVKWSKAKHVNLNVICLSILRLFHWWYGLYMRCPVWYGGISFPMLGSFSAVLHWGSRFHKRTGRWKGWTRVVILSCVWVWCSFPSIRAYV